jgi:hypothetical protein
MQDIKARRAKPQDKSNKLTDERRIYLLVTVAGRKLWRFDCRHDGKRKTLAPGALCLPVRDHEFLRCTPGNGKRQLSPRLGREIS